MVSQCPTQPVYTAGPVPVVPSVALVNGLLSPLQPLLIVAVALMVQSYSLQDFTGLLHPLTVGHLKQILRLEVVQCKHHPLTWFSPSPEAVSRGVALGANTKEHILKQSHYFLRLPEILLPNAQSAARHHQYSSISWDHGGLHTLTKGTTSASRSNKIGDQEFQMLTVQYSLPTHSTDMERLRERGRHSPNLPNGLMQEWVNFDITYIEELAVHVKFEPESDPESQVEQVDPIHLRKPEWRQDISECAPGISTTTTTPPAPPPSQPNPPPSEPTELTQMLARVDHGPRTHPRLICCSGGEPDAISDNYNCHEVNEAPRLNKFNTCPPDSPFQMHLKTSLTAGTYRARVAYSGDNGNVLPDAQDIDAIVLRQGAKSMAAVGVLPKKAHPKELNDYRPVALTSHVMKTMERLLLNHLRPQVHHAEDPLQFAYREKPLLLRDKLMKMEVDMHLVTWITDYLTGRPQHVRIRDCSSDTVISSTGAPQGTVLSPVLFTLYTSDFKYNSELCHMQKFSDDTAIVGCVRNGQEREYRSLVEDFVEWCTTNHLKLNITKTKEMCIDFRRSRPSQQPISIKGVDVEVVRSYRYLGVHLDERLDWSVNTDIVYKKAQSRLYFLRRLGSFRICQKLLLMFYQSVVASVLFYAVVCWGGSISKRDAGRLDRLVRKAGSVLGLELESLTPLAERRALNKLLNIMDNVHNPLHTTIIRQRSSFSGRLLSQSCSTDRLRKSFVPQAIRLFNSSHCQPVGRRVKREVGVLEDSAPLVYDITILGLTSWERANPSIFVERLLIVGWTLSTSMAKSNIILLADTS
ncbi:hypothetical protein NFI96_000495 [Prochilodus magdalenae]|nr:hypothetical protein NFI96_000495 [Prochilodus magdalenae]